MLIPIETPLLVKEYLESRFGSPISLPKTASIDLGVKIAICAGISLNNMHAHSTERKVKASLIVTDSLFNKKIPTPPNSAQREAIAQQLHKYVLEQVSLEVAIISCTRKKSISQSINALIHKHRLTADAENIRQIFERGKRAMNFDREISPLNKIS